MKLRMLRAAIASGGDVNAELLTRKEHLVVGVHYKKKEHRPLLMVAVLIVNCKCHSTCSTMCH